ncbi:enoyl-CoA hydratase/isomerase family protein [Candidatus Solirubrobacter pratensis]|uniref:enoyl-CoA hydratase/isomerase family protein n=1 Tax=Candidatus Solirubrobacter pratensis TaxID=1298857 RepID=UPI00040C0B2A|nr:enoyl-CoA hydratase/isomerase family protein [Candidatus Solirubrobacter pratensis]
MPFGEDLDAYLSEHVAGICADLGPLRAEELVYAAADRVPGLPTREQVAAEREHLQKDKAGLEIAQGVFLGHVLARPDTGMQLVETMLRPISTAEQLADLRSTGRVDLGAAVVERRGNVGYLEMRNPRHLNAEDDTTLPASEAAVDLMGLDPEIEICVLRGGVVQHPRYAGRRILGAGLNLTHLYHGRISYLFFPVRDLGFVHKIYRGTKLWIAAAETYAIGGACQLLLCVDHIIAEEGCRFTLPARNEGIIPGAANLRLPRFVGDRAARRAILSGEELDVHAMADEIVSHEEMDAAIEARAAALSTAGAVSGSANRAAFRVAQEPLDVFREYMAVYSREQAACHFSPALIRNLEENWRAHERAA